MRVVVVAGLLLAGACAEDTTELDADPPPPVRGERIEACEVHGGRDAEYRAGLAEALARDPLGEPPPLTAAELAVLENRFRPVLAWQFHLAPEVVATEVVGAADHFGDNIRRYSSHRVTSYLRSTGPRTVGVALESPYDTTCGDRWLLAADSLPSLPTPSTECSGSSGSHPDGPTVHSVLPIPHTLAQRAEVWDWLDASTPTYRLWPLDVEASAVRYTQPRAPWSDEPGWLEAVAMSHATVTIEVLSSTTSAAGVHDVELLVARDGSLVARHRQQVRLRFTCGDSRLTTVGFRAVALVVSTDRDLTPGRMYLIPGLLLPDSPEVISAVNGLRNRLDNPPRD